MWTNENRAKYKRDHLRYPSDLTDEEWVHVEPLIPPARRGGRKRETDMREALNAIMYVEHGMPLALPPQDPDDRGGVAPEAARSSAVAPERFTSSE
jgi:transposase